MPADRDHGFNQRSLRWRLLLPLVGVGVVLIALSSVATFVFANRMLGQQLATRAGELARLVGLAAGSRDGDLARQVNAYSAARDVDLIVVIEHQRIIASNNGALIGRPANLLAGVLGRVLATAAEQHVAVMQSEAQRLAVALPVTSAAGVRAAGALVAVTLRSDVIAGEARASAAFSALLLALGLGAVVVTAAIAVELRIIRPLRTMRRRLDSDREESDPVAAGLDDDDVGRVAAAFDRVHGQLAERRREVADREAHLRSLFDATTDGILVVDTIGRIESANPAAERLFACHDRRLVGRLIGTLVPPERRGVMENGFLRAVAQGAAWPGLHAEVSVRRDDGSPVAIAIAINPTRVHGGLRYVAMLRDLTAEQRMRARATGLAEGIRQMHELASAQYLEHADRVQGALALGRERFGLDDAYLVRRDGDGAIALTASLATDCPPDTVFPLLRVASDLALVGDEPVALHQITGADRDLLANQHGRPVQAVLAQRIMVEGQPWGVLVFASETARSEPFDPAHLDLLGLLARLLGGEVARAERLEELRRARSAAEAAANAKSSFLATMSHELRTPMNGVIGIASLLVNTPLNPEQQDYVATIRSSGEALLTLLNDILDFSKIEAGRLEIEHIPFDLRTLAEDAIGLFAMPAHEKGLELALRVAAAVPARLVGDPARLRQILLNLLGNAVKFTAAGQVLLAIDGDQDGDAWALRVDVNDSGIGLTAAQQGRLFSPFIQADASTTRRFGGTGLGLAISKRLAELMGGGIGLVSAPGQGSTFTLSLRLPTAEAVDVAAPAVLPDSPRLLVFSHQGLHRGIIVELAARWGARAEPTADAAVALATLAAGGDDPVRLMVIERDIPGGAAAFAVRLRAAGSSVPLVLLAAQGGGGDRSEAAAGFTFTVSRPLRAEALRKVCADALGLGVPARPQPAKGPATADFAALGLRVLLAEDQAVNQKVATRLLERLGCQVVLAMNGVQAVASAGGDRFDLILMDCRMPEMDGFAATQAIRGGTSPNRETPIIALTANASAGDREECLVAGMDDHLAKPVTAESLRAMLRRWQTGTATPADHGRP